MLFICCGFMVELDGLSGGGWIGGLLKESLFAVVSEYVCLVVVATRGLVGLILGDLRA